MARLFLQGFQGEQRLRLIPHWPFVCSKSNIDCTLSSKPNICIQIIRTSIMHLNQEKKTFKYQICGFNNRIILCNDVTILCDILCFVPTQSPQIQMSGKGGIIIIKDKKTQKITSQAGLYIGFKRRKRICQSWHQSGITETEKAGWYCLPGLLCCHFEHGRQEKNGEFLFHNNYSHTFDLVCISLIWYCISLIWYDPKES